MDKTEKQVQAEVLRAIGGRADVRIFRNQVGTGYVCDKRNTAVKRLPGGVEAVTLYNPRRVSFGLHQGSPDLIGIKRVRITPDMVGKSVGVFVALEVKAPGAKAKAEQSNFLIMLSNFGAISGLCNSVESANNIIEGL